MKNIDYALNPNDYAVAKELYVQVAALIAMVVAANIIGLPENYELKELNRAYVLITNELQKLYRRNKELSAIEPKPIWETFEVLDSATWEINEFFESLDESNVLHAHIARIDRLCIISGNEISNLSEEQVKLIDYGETTRKKYGKLLEEAKAENKKRQESEWYIPVYNLTQKPDGTVIVNDVLRLKKPHAGSAADNLLTQALNTPHELFKPDIGKTARSLSIILSNSGFTPALKALFFPTVNSNRGVLFRPTITRIQADEEGIDTSVLDLKLKDLGADIAHISL